MSLAERPVFKPSLILNFWVPIGDRLGMRKATLTYKGGLSTFVERLGDLYYGSRPLQFSLGGLCLLFGHPLFYLRGRALDQILRLAQPEAG